MAAIKPDPLAEATRYVTVAELARAVGLTIFPIYDAIESGRLRAERTVNSRYRIAVEDARAFIEQRATVKAKRAGANGGAG